MGRRESEGAVVGPVSDVRTVMRIILRHLIRYPHAKDTADGVRFWCDLYGVTVPCRVVEDALSELARLNLVVLEAYGRLGRVVYSRADVAAGEELREAWRGNARTEGHSQERS